MKTPIFLRSTHWILSFLLVWSASSSTADVPRASIRNAGTNGIAIDWSALPAAQGYRVEYKDALGTNAWQPCPIQDQWPLSGLSWTDDRPSVGGRYYRVMANTTVRGHIVSFRLSQSFNQIVLGKLLYDNNIPLVPLYSVDVFQVQYDTITPDGAPTTASGVLVAPHNAGKAVPLVSHQHGTVVLTNDVASQGGGELILGLAFASVGYATSMPDYLGMGNGSGLHPYVHARSEATAAVDMLRASRTICTQQNVTLNGQLFLIGYSQGGQATMALHREIEAWHTNEFTITASAPMAGPHDMSGTMANIMTSDQAYGSPDYLPYTLFSYNSVYRMFNSVAEALQNPYATNLPPLYDGRHSASQINALMPSVPSQILKPEYLQAFRDDPNHPLRLALRANDLYRWTPRAAMHLYHCAGDTTVPYTNSVVAWSHFQTNGAAHVQLIDPYPIGTHSTGAYPCFLAAKGWFDSLKQ